MRGRRGGLVGLVAALAMLTASCAASSQEAAPFAGRWKSIGFGTYLVIEGNDVEVYEHTSVSCGRVFEGVAAGISAVAEIDGGRLVIDDGGREVRYDRIDALPARCAGAFATEDPAWSFTVLVATFGEQYAFLDERAPDWEVRAAEIGGRLTPDSTDGELVEAIADLLRPLGDAQVRLIVDEDGILGEGRVWRSVETPAATARLRDRLRSGVVRLAGDADVAEDGSVVTGRLPGGAGYLGLLSFAGSDPDPEEAEERLARRVDQLLSELADAPGLVIDLRANAGGFLEQALLVASRFVPTERVVARSEARIDGTDEFVGSGDVTVRPMPTGVYTGPVVVLTGPGTIGSAEVLMLALRGLPGVTVVGERTAGSIAPLVTRTLPNGWAVGLSNSRIYGADGVAWDVGGIPPDHLVPVGVADLDGGGDPALDRAEALLGG